MQYSALKTAVETVTGTSTDTGRFLNKGQLELAKLSKRTKKAALTFTAGVATFASTYLIPQKLLWDGKEIKPSPSDMYIYDNTSNPDTWTILDTQIVLNTEITSSTLGVLVYTPRPADMSLDADTPELTDSDDALIAFARWQIYDDGEDVQEAAFWENKWLKEAAAWQKLDNGRHKQVHKIRRV